jgi:hypothetical protein
MQKTKIPIEIETMFNEFIKHNKTIKDPTIDLCLPFQKTFFTINCTDFFEIVNTKNVNVCAVRKYLQNEYTIFCEIK